MFMKNVFEDGRLIGLTDIRESSVWCGAVVKYQQKFYEVLDVQTTALQVAEIDPRPPSFHVLMRSTGPRLEQMAHRGHEHTKGSAK